ncbi:type II secretion system protein [Pseudobdellovibrio exovorus]|uniref:Putative general secretion pathway protein I n=1 Tax=Pseudobdellovibrio exovorus JSS TaxID=1184267 RepID=M4V8L5_9BACT|nr:prepilin-type N-terminal cleavage/methylation domain-containing protein [Pseudobdellovibrio exovorus]AGH95742.1 putative general secretion pathway protein I [Pseudobdellovibrio exovorus JSS]
MRLQQCSSSKKTRGFTLIEVVLAMAVMASGLFILVNSWSGTYSRLVKTQAQVQLAALLERKVAEIEREYKNKSLESIPEEKEDNFGSDLAQYSWKLKSRKLEVPDLSAALAAQDGEVNSSMIEIMKTFTDHLSKSVKEVNISVTYNEGRKPLTADVTIYMVDYDRPLPIPGAGATQ